MSSTAYDVKTFAHRYLGLPADLEEDRPTFVLLKRYCDACEDQDTTPLDQLFDLIAEYADLHNPVKLFPGEPDDRD